MSLLRISPMVVRCQLRGQAAATLTSMFHLPVFRRCSSSISMADVKIPPLPVDADKKIQEADSAYRRAYDALPSTYPPHALGDPHENIDAYRKRLLYRSKQRGWLEVDLMLGSWATKHLKELEDSQLKEYESILNLETVDLFNIILGRADLPEELNGPVMQSIMKHVGDSPLGRASPKGYAEVKTMMSN